MESYAEVKFTGVTLKRGIRERIDYMWLQCTIQCTLQGTAHCIIAIVLVQNIATRISKINTIKCFQQNQQIHMYTVFK